MDFAREWTAFALEAEYEDFGPGRIVKAHNARLADLTLNADPPSNARSVQLTGGCGWHGFITSGIATPA